ncbi:MAG: hypothetical protein HW380_369 [Magnetococcales bacterium]|nr:hypothetical protein [Magnetococcales bacterium]HIJ83946.1 hypothetical protein [Magnetococcales bacterium]
MPRSDKDNMLSALVNSNGQLSYSRLIEVLDWDEDKFKSVLNQIINEELAEKYRCRGGGVRLTESGLSSSARLKKIKSAVAAEIELYPILIDLLKEDAEFEEENSDVFDISRMRMSGLWQNPDVLKITVTDYSVLKKKIIHVTSFEVKKADSWGINSVFEAASHSRFVNDSYFVLERENEEISGLEEAIDACRYFGVGLMIMFKSDEGFYKKVILEADTKQPKDDYLENFLTGAIQHDDNIKKFIKKYY